MDPLPEMVPTSAVPFNAIMVAVHFSLASRPSQLLSFIDNELQHV